MKIGEMGEIGLIERFRKKIRTDSSVLIGPGDDAAVIRWRNGHLLLFTCDMLVEDVHFRRKQASPRQIGYKALAVNISDIAAMGGVPKHGVVSLGLPGNTSAGFINKLFSGMKSLADKFRVNLVGGDVNRSDKLVISIALLGEAKKDELLTRSGASPGDIIMATGSLGGSGSGRHLNFMPRVKEARFLVKNFNITSMIDITDGLSNDLAGICRESRAGAVIYESMIPLSRQAGSLRNALSDGEDFELLFTVSKKYAGPIIDTFKKRTGTSITAIGEIRTASKGIKIIDKFGRARPLKPVGFSHF